MRRALFICAALVLLSSCGSKVGPGSRQDTGAPADFSFTTFEGDRFAAAEQRGTPVVLNFWESW